jgi:hypothetical protein
MSHSDLVHTPSKSARSAGRTHYRKVGRHRKQAWNRIPARLLPRLWSSIQEPPFLFLLPTLPWLSPNSIIYCILNWVNLSVLSSDSYLDIKVRNTNSSFRTSLIWLWLVGMPKNNVAWGEKRIDDDTMAFIDFLNFRWMMMVPYVRTCYGRPARLNWMVAKLTYHQITTMTNKATCSLLLHVRCCFVPLPIQHTSRRHGHRLQLTS